MDFKELRQRLADEAAAKKICKEWHRRITQATTREELLRLFIDGLDFVSANSYPSAELRAEFADIAPHFGVYITGKHTAPHTRRVITCLDADVAALYSDFDVAEVYAFDNSRVSIVAEGYAKIFVTAYDNAIIKASAEGQAKVIIKTFGAKVSAQKFSEQAITKIINAEA